MVIHRAFALMPGRAGPSRGSQARMAQQGSERTLPLGAEREAGAVTGKRRSPPADTRPVAANDNLPPISEEAQAAILRIARIIGRQMAAGGRGADASGQ